MKNTIKIILLLAIICMTFTTLSFAAGTILSLNGEKTAKPGETKTINVKLDSDVLIGAMTLKIETSSNIKIESVSPKNSWSLTYNEETKTANLVKAAGAKSEEILEIKYTVGTVEGKENIKINVNEPITTDYNEVTIPDVTFEITVAKEETKEDKEETPTNVKLDEITVTTAPTKTSYAEGENFDKTGMKVTATYSDGSKKEVTNFTVTDGEKLKADATKVTISYIEDGITKTTEQKITVIKAEDKEEDKEEDKKEEDKKEEDKKEENKKEEDKKEEQKNNTVDNTVVDKDIPKTGTEDMFLGIAILLVVVGIISYIGYVKNKDI